MTELDGRNRGQGWASWTIAALAAGVVLAGLAIAGGPAQARKERRDDMRAADLSRLSMHISCLVGDSGLRELPADLGPTDGCPGPVPLTNSQTGEQYRIEPLEHGKYRLCAAFELAPAENRWEYRWASEQRDGDCVIYSLPELRTQPDSPPASQPEPQHSDPQPDETADGTPG